MSIRIPPTPSIDSIDPLFTSLADTLRQPSGKDSSSERLMPFLCLIGALAIMGSVLHIGALSLTQAPQSFVSQFVASAITLLFEGVGV